MNFASSSKSARTRRFILEKAGPIFNKKGYSGTSLQDILEATQLTKGALYGNFENKDEIALAAFEYNLAWIKKGLIDAMSLQVKAVNKLLAMVEFYRREYVAIALQGGCPLMNTAIEADDAVPLLRHKVREGIIDWVEALKTIIETGKLTGEIRQEACTNTYASLLITLIEGGIMMAKITGESSHLFTALDKADQLIQLELH